MPKRREIDERDIDSLLKALTDLQIAELSVRLRKKYTGFVNLDNLIRSVRYWIEKAAAILKLELSALSDRLIEQLN